LEQLLWRAVSFGSPPEICTSCLRKKKRASGGEKMKVVGKDVVLLSLQLLLFLPLRFLFSLVS
jgi:hypothetical protein